MTLFKKILGHLDTLIRVIPDTFEVHKPKFKSERLRRLCSLKPIVGEEEDENKETAATTKPPSSGKKADLDMKEDDEGSQKSSGTPVKVKGSQKSSSSNDDYKIIESPDGLMDNYLPLLKPFDQNICWYQSAEHY